MPLQHCPACGQRSGMNAALRSVPGSWSHFMRESERRLSMNRQKAREVLDCASPLALSLAPSSFPKRQRAAAVQDAGASKQPPFGSWFPVRDREIMEPP